MNCCEAIGVKRVSLMSMKTTTTKKLKNPLPKMIFNVCHIIVSHVPCVPNQPGFDNPNRPDKCSFASGYRNALLSHLKSYRPHDHIRRQLRRHMKNVRLLKNNHIAPTLLQLNTGRDGRNQRYPQGELFQITPSKCVYCTVSWNVARLV